MTEISQTEASHPGEEPVVRQARRRTLATDTLRRLSRNPAFIVSSVYLAVVIVAAVYPPLLAGLFGEGDPSGRACDITRSLQPPDSQHPFGLDVQGCDLYTQVVYGARPSIVIGVVVTVVSALIAIVLGTVAGYLGGWVDALYGRITDIFYGFPFMIAAIVILTTLPRRTVLSVALVLAAFSWPFMSRLMRSSVLSVKSSEYVQAARALGASPIRIMSRHILPNAISPILVTAALSIGGTIAGEAGLTFIGVGLQLPTISWGLQLNTAQNYFIAAPHTLFFPALVLTLTVVSFTLLGDAIRDAMDPRSAR